MDGFKNTRNYMDRVICGGDCAGMKVLVLDKYTAQVVSCVYSQTEILQNEVFLVTRLDDLKEKSNKNSDLSPKDNNIGNSETARASSSHLKAVLFIRPTEINIGLLLRELSSPQYREYYIYFSAIVQTGQLRLIAENDVNEKVQKIVELYADYVPINRDLITLQCRNTLPMTTAVGTSRASQHSHLYERNLQGLQSILLSFKRSPYAIRYAGSSPCAQELAQDIAVCIQRDEIFHFQNHETKSNSNLNHHSINHQGASSSNVANVNDGAGLLLLILDRRDDPVTPLLSQWTYQAMVHELLGLNNHRVILRGCPNIPSPDLEEVVLGIHDQFFQTNKHLNFGELGENIQSYLKEYQKQTQKHGSLMEKTAGNSTSTERLESESSSLSLDDMQQFMEKFPELRTQSHNVSKHVVIMGELARLVDVCSLMEVSQFEQELACNDDHNTHWNQLTEKLMSDKIAIPDKLRLGLLYALRYEMTGKLHQMVNIMKKHGVPQEMVSLVQSMLRYGGMKSRGPGLYGEHHSTFTKMTKSLITNIQGVENIYSQHVPLLIDVVTDILKGKLRKENYPFVQTYSSPATNNVNNNRNHHTTASMHQHHTIKTKSQNSADFSNNPYMIPSEIIIFMVGGVTYEEGTKINEFNVNNRGRGIQIVLGGSTVHNSTSFLEELKSTCY